MIGHGPPESAYRMGARELTPAAILGGADDFELTAGSN